MNLSSQNITIIAAVFIVGFLLMIPFAIMQSKRKKKAADFVSQNEHQAILHLYAQAPVIDGQKVKEMAYVRGADLQYTVALEPGKHTVLAKYMVSEPVLGKNINYTTPKPVESEVFLEAGHEYTLSLYFYSPAQRKAYYEGDVGEDIYSQTLEISGSGLDGHKNAYIICYKEK